MGLGLVVGVHGVRGRGRVRVRVIGLRGVGLGLGLPEEGCGGGGIEAEHGGRLRVSAVRHSN